MWGVLGTSPQATAVRMPTVPLMCLPPTNMGNPSSRWHPGDSRDLPRRLLGQHLCLPRSHTPGTTSCSPS